MNESMNDILILDNFFENPDSVRNYALKIEYQEPNENDGWRGYRSDIIDNEITKYTNKIITEKTYKCFHSIFYFHYSLEETKETCYPSFDEYKVHTDGCLYAGVVYLNPHPNKSCGTSFYDSNMNVFKEVENVYNRLVFYPSSILHAPTDLFGENIETSRLTLTIFAF